MWVSSLTQYWHALKYFTNEINQKKAQKDFIKIYKKIKKNRKYFFSAKDLAMVESLAKDGFNIPKEFNYKEIDNLIDSTRKSSCDYLN